MLEVASQLTGGEACQWERGGLYTYCSVHIYLCVYIIFMYNMWAVGHNIYLCDF